MLGGVRRFVASSHSCKTGRLEAQIPADPGGPKGDYPSFDVQHVRRQPAATGTSLAVRHFPRARNLSHAGTSASWGRESSTECALLIPVPLVEVKKRWALWSTAMRAEGAARWHAPRVQRLLRAHPAAGCDLFSHAHYRECTRAVNRNFRTGH